ERGLFDAAEGSPMLPMLCEAYARSGRHEDAAAALERFEASMLDERPLALALVARCRGLLDDDAGFAEAFERARTLLLYGERLRREKRRMEARARLNEALAIFEELGTTAWSRRALAELAATGERARRRKDATRADLTPQELVVARL